MNPEEAEGEVRASKIDLTPLVILYYGSFQCDASVVVLIGVEFSYVFIYLLKFGQLCGRLLENNTRLTICSLG